MVRKWTGHESHALREAMRVSQRDFANNLGVSAKAVANWESGGAGIVQRPESQAILDTKLRQVSDEVRARFELILGTGGDQPGSPLAGDPETEEDVKGPPTLLSLLLGKRHWKQYRTFDAQFRRAARELAAQEEEPWIADLTVSEATFERWLFGKVKNGPHPDASRVLEHMFGYPVQELLSRAGAPDREGSPDTAATRRTDETPSPPSPHGEIVKAVTRANEVPRPAQRPASNEARDLWETGYDSDEELMRRRSFLITLAALAGIGAADTPAAVEAIRQELNLSLIEERAGTHADEWQEITLDYGETYPTAAPAELIRTLMVDMLGMQAALRRNSDDTARQPDLLRAASLLSAFTAQTVANMGQPLEAKRWWRTAKNAADRSGDPYSVLWVRGREIVRAMESRPVPVILGLIEEAQGATSNAPPEATLELIAAKAQTLALAGRKHDATQALGELRNQFEESPGGFSGNILSWGQERLHSTESFSYSRLGDLPKAENATADGIRLRTANGDTSIRHKAQLQLNLAFALVSSGDISGGLSHARAVISSLPESQSGMRVDDGRKLLGMVPITEQHRTGVQEYRAWINSLSGPAKE